METKPETNLPMKRKADDVSSMEDEKKLKKPNSFPAAEKEQVVDKEMGKIHADPLSMLRHYNVNKLEIITKDDNIIFGEFSWPKTVKTNYLVFRSGKDDSPKDYYSLECLLFLLKHVNLFHQNYVRKAEAENVPVVRRPARKKLLAYLNGKTPTADAIDKSAPLEMPTQVG